MGACLPTVAYTGMAASNRRPRVSASNRRPRVAVEDDGKGRRPRTTVEDDSRRRADGNRPFMP